MSTTFFDQSADSVFSAALSVQSQRSNLANYAIQQAARYIQNNNQDAALKEFKKALAFDSENYTAHKYIGQIYMSKGKNTEAIKEFKENVRLQPLSVNALVDLGNAYVQNKDYKGAEDSLKKAAKLDPMNPVPDYTLGHVYLNTDRLGEAEAEFKKVQKISPKDANVYYSLGMLYNKEGKYEDAVKNLEKAVSLKKDFSAANYELGVAYNGVGNSDKAQAQLTILNSKDTALAKDLKAVIDKPQIVSMDTSKSGGFSELMGPGTPVWALDIQTLREADSSKVFSIDIQFNNDMDIGSVMNPSNWSISKANSTKAGYYNSMIPVSSKEAKVAPLPLSVDYNALERTATVKFRIAQNAAGNATIDPSHLVFKFMGKDAAGRKMDPKADEIDGYALESF